MKKFFEALFLIWAVIILAVILLNSYDISNINQEVVVETVEVYPDDYEELRNECEAWKQMHDSAMNGVEYWSDVAYNLSTKECEDCADAAAELEAHLIKCESEYPTATTVYKALKEAGYSDAVTCGIIGNMMVECGYSKLGLYPYSINKTENAYGLCQWRYKYNKEVYNASLEDQIEYLLSDIAEKMDSYGDLYKEGFDYETFYELESVEDAALAFAKVYERCKVSETGYANRQLCALKAYAYFVR